MHSGSLFLFNWLAGWLAGWCRFGVVSGVGLLVRVSSTEYLVRLGDVQ